MEYVSLKISYWFLKKGYITEQQVDDIRYALEVVISNVLPFITILLLGIKMHQETKMIIFFLVFIGFRTLRDRYHAPTFIKCYFLTVGSFLLCLFTSLVIRQADQLPFTTYVTGLNILLLILFKERINEGQDNKSNTIYNSIFIIFNIFCLVVFSLSYGEISAFSALVGTIIIVTSIAK